MSDLSGQITKSVAAAVVNADATTPTWVQRGFDGATPTRASAGKYTLTFNEPVPKASTIATATLQEGVVAGGGQAIEALIATDGSSVAVSISDGTAFADLDFFISVESIFPLNP